MLGECMSAEARVKTGLDTRADVNMGGAPRRLLDCRMRREHDRKAMECVRAQEVCFLHASSCAHA